MTAPTGASPRCGGRFGLGERQLHVIVVIHEIRLLRCRQSPSAARFAAASGDRAGGSGTLRMPHRRSSPPADVRRCPTADILHAVPPRSGLRRAARADAGGRLFPRAVRRRRTCRRPRRRARRLSDKLLHFGGYAVLTCCVLAGWELTIGMLEPKHYFAVWLAGTLYGAIDEITQIPVGRTCDMNDGLADVLGIVMRHCRRSNWCEPLLIRASRGCAGKRLLSANDAQ